MSEVLLEMRDIRKAYPGVLALSNVNLKVQRGEVHGLMGENGAGKSTLIKVLAGAIKPDSGQIIFEGRPFNGLDPRTAMDLGIGVIYQEFNLVPYMSVADNIFWVTSSVGDRSLCPEGRSRRRSRCSIRWGSISILPCRSAN